METTVATTASQGGVWGGGNQPLRASYGKMMMWFFIVSDALTFSGFLAAYGFSRFKFVDAWPIADEVFTHFPFLHGVPAPMFYVAFMTFILIFSSVTMVLAVDAGHKMKQSKVAIYMFLTIIGGAIFVGSQAWEWATFIKGDYGASYQACDVYKNILSSFIICNKTKPFRFVKKFYCSFHFSIVIH
jgi:cytochrome c oxidase subunit 3